MKKTILLLLLFFPLLTLLRFGTVVHAQDCNQLDFSFKVLNCVAPYIVEFKADTLHLFPPGSTITWKFDCNNPDFHQTGTDNPKSISFPAPGVISVCLTFVLPNGTICKKCKDINIQPTTPPDFTATPNPACDPTTPITICATGGQGIIHYIWLTPDKTDGPPCITKVFSLGCHNVSLVYTDVNGCTDEVKKDTFICVYPKLNVDFKANPIEICLPDNNTATFSPIITGEIAGKHFVQSYQWTFASGNPSSSTSANPQVSYSGVAPGTYAVHLKVTTNTGCTYEHDGVIKIYKKPIVTIAPSAQVGPLCFGETFQFNNTTANGGDCNFTWVASGGSIDPSGLYTAPNEPGTYTVTLQCKQGSNCIATSPPTTVIVVGVPIDFTAIITDRAICDDLPHTSTFHITPNPGLIGCSFTWKIYKSPGQLIETLGPFNSLDFQYTFVDEACYDIEVQADCPGNCDPSKKKLKYVVAAKPVADFSVNETDYCVGKKICPINTSSQAGCPLALTYKWEFKKLPDGPWKFWSNEENPCVPINEPGSYQLSLTVSNMEQCPDKYIYPVTLVIGGVVGDIVVDQYNICNPGNVNITIANVVNSAQGNVKVKWEITPNNGVTINGHTLPDSAISVFTGQLHVEEPNIYVLKVTLTNDAGCSFVIKDTLLVSFFLNINVEGGIACKGTPVQMTATSQINPISTINWGPITGPDTATIDAPTSLSPMITFPAAGAYTIHIEATTNETVPPCTVTKDTVIIVQDINPIVSLEADVLSCAPVLADLKALPLPPEGVSYVFNFGNGDTSTATPNPFGSNLYRTNGVFCVSVTVTGANGCVQTSPCVPLTILGPIPDVTPNVDTICQADTNQTQFDVVFDMTQVDADKIIFSYGGGELAQEEFTAPIPQPTLTRSYKINFLPGECKRTLSPQVVAYKKIVLGGETKDCNPILYDVPPITIYRKPIAKVDYNPQNATCPPFTMPFDGTSKNCPSVWEWDFNGDGTVDYVTPTVDHTFQPGDPITIKLKVFNEAGCTDEKQFNLDIKGLPTAAFESPDPHVCQGDTVRFINKAEGVKDAQGNLISKLTKLVWNFGDGTPEVIQNLSPPPADPDPVHIYLTVDTFTVTLKAIAENDCFRIDTLEDYVTLTKPVAEYTSEKPYPLIALYPPTVTVTFDSEPSENDQKWEWDFTDGTPISDEAKPKHDFKSIGVFQPRLIVTDQYGCKDTVQHGPYDIRQFDLNIPNVVTPNGDGTNDKFRITYTGFERYNLSIYDRWGNLIKGDITNPEDGWDVLIGNKVAPAGSYYYVLKIGDKVKAGDFTVLPSTPK